MFDVYLLKMPSRRKKCMENEQLNTILMQRKKKMETQL